MKPHIDHIWCSCRLMSYFPVAAMKYHAKATSVEGRVCLELTVPEG